MKRPFLACLILLLAIPVAMPAFAQLLSPGTPPATATSAPAAPSGPQSLAANQVQPLDRIVAVVNQGVILQSQLDRTMTTVSRQITSSGGKLPPQKVLKKQVLQRLILNQLEVQMAHNKGLRVSDNQVDGTIASIARQHKLTVPQLQATMQQQGVDYAAYRQQLRNQLLVRKLQQKVTQRASQVSDAEINNLISSPAFKQGQVHLARILVGLPEGANAAQIAKAKAKASKIMSKLLAGKSFSALAISDSDAPEALNGGDLGWMRVDELPPPVRKVVDALQPGAYTRPLRDPSGFTILKLEGRRTPDTKRIVTEYHARHLMIKPDALLNEQAAKAKITKLYHEIVDGHASFAALAKKDSDDPTTANVGGDMGWVTKDQWGAVMGKMLASMQPGQVTPPFKSPNGAWHMIQLLGKRKANKTKSIEREQAREAIAARKGRQAYQQFVRNLESAAYISIRIPELAGDGINDSHSSP